MSGPACADRGADLFVLARGGDPGDPAFRAHVESCPDCREELRALRDLARRLPLATGTLAPRPGTRETVIRAADRAEPGLPPPARGGRILVWAVPAGLLAASAAAVLIVAFRPDDGSRAGIAVSALHGAVGGGPLADGRLTRGETVTARGTLSVRLGAPLDAEAVFGEGAAFRLPPAGGAAAGGRALDLASGAAYFDAGAAAAGGELRVDAGGDTVVRAKGARFAVEVRGNGSRVVYAERGVVTVEAAGRRVEARGPARVDVPPGEAPREPVPAEPTDATGWFAYPVVTASLEANPSGEGRDLVVTLTPSVPRTIPVAPFSRFDPHFTVRATREGTGLRQIPVEARMLRRPPPEAEPSAPGPPGAFLLSAERPYALRVDPALLGLDPGEWQVGVIYNASLPGGLWRGTRASNTVDLQVR